LFTSSLRRKPEDFASIALFLIKTVEELGQGLPWSSAKMVEPVACFKPVHICTDGTFCTDMMFVTAIGNSGWKCPQKPE